MISWIVASNNKNTLEGNLLSTLEPLEDGDELIVECALSIAAAYNRGAKKANNLVRCYLHHDVQIIDKLTLRNQLIKHCSPGVGIVGLIGSRTRTVPWWNGDKLGSVVDARLGLLDFGPGGNAAYLDGLLLASCHPLTWDEDFKGWHLYDHDICEQMIRRYKLSNFALSNGASLVRHNTSGPTNTAALLGWDPAIEHFNEKWQ